MSVILDVGGKPADGLPYFNNEPFVVVAGGTGFVGSHVVQALLENGYKIVCISRGQRRSSPSNDNIIFNNNLIYLDFDLTDANASTEKLVESLRNCLAIVNLVGIKMEKQDQTFENVHMGIVKQLLDLTRKINAKRFIHVSVLCARPDPTSGYHDTKYRSEELIKTSGVPYTILRPSVIYGRGDGMITALAGVIRAAPVFPLIGDGSSLHQPIMVTDLATSLVACLTSEKAIGKSYDLVGPTKVTTREMVHIVSDGMGLPTYSFPFPLFLHKIGAEVSTVLLPDPPATPTQLKMLVEGMVGDSSQIRSDLDMPKLCTTVLGPNVVQQFESQIPSTAGFSLRLFSSRSHYAWMEPHRSILKQAQILALGAFGLILLLCAFVGNLRVAVILFYLFAGVGIFSQMRTQLRWTVEMLQPPPPDVRLRHAFLGLGFGVALCFFLKYLFPIPQDVEAWKALADQWRSFWAFLFVFFVAIPTDEILWDGAIALPFLARFACGKVEHEKTGSGDDISQRGLGYLPCLIFALFYGVSISFLLGTQGIIVFALVGLATSVLTVKTEKLVAGMVCKTIVWVALLLWTRS